MMATGQLKAPPVFKEDGDYMSWKNDIEVWEMFTDIEQKKRGPAVYLSLTGKAREAVRDLKPAELGGNNGVQIILAKLDSYFLLSAVNISEENEKLARTTCSVLDYTHMKNTIMKIFGHP